jgi:transcriptional regulator with XRE-family HTH domain
MVDLFYKSCYYEYKGGVSMKYIIKKEIAEQIDNRHHRKKLMEELGLSKCYLSLIFCGRRNLRKCTAYSITKCIDMEKDILDYFDEV